jgi:hypothetical protein
MGGREVREGEDRKEKGVPVCVFLYSPDFGCHEKKLTKK